MAACYPGLVKSPEQQQEVEGKKLLFKRVEDLTEEQKEQYRQDPLSWWTINRQPLAGNLTIRGTEAVVFNYCRQHNITVNPFGLPIQREDLIPDLNVIDLSDKKVLVQCKWFNCLLMTTSSHGYCQKHYDRTWLVRQEEFDRAITNKGMEDRLRRNQLAPQPD